MAHTYKSSGSPEASRDSGQSNMTALQVTSLTKDYGKTRALDGVSVSFSQGRVTAVVGANGSGKSTLLGVLSGKLAPTTGQVNGPSGQAIRSIRQALDLGIVLVPQEPTLAPHLKVWQNVTLARPERRFGVFLQDKQARSSAEAHIHGLLPADVLDRATGDLNKSSRQLVQIAAAMAVDPKVLLLDEPTAVLDEDGVRALHSLVNRFVAGGGTAVVVSHRLRDVLALADDVVLLRGGHLDLAMAIDQSTELAIMKLLSAEDHAERPPHDASEAPVVLEARDVVGWRGLEVSEFRVHAGEIVGIAGQSGSGRSRLAAVLAGCHRASGTVTVTGKALKLGSVRSARSSEIAYIPEDRYSAAIMANQSVEHNLLLGRATRGASRRRFRRRSAERRQAQSLVDAYDVRPADIFRPAGLLSGGNQQKVVVARALADSPKVVIADEPTQGVDAGARAAIHRALFNVAATGTAVVAVCSDFEELFEIADRIVVLSEGRIVLDQPRASITQDQIMAASLGMHEQTTPTSAHFDLVTKG